MFRLILLHVVLIVSALSALAWTIQPSSYSKFAPPALKSTYYGASYRRTHRSLPTLSSSVVSDSALKPPPPTPWVNATADSLLDEFSELQNDPSIGSLLQQALTTDTDSTLTMDTNRRASWQPYAEGKKDLRDFFGQWITHTPVPEATSSHPAVDELDSLGFYIETWDYLAR